MKYTIEIDEVITAPELNQEPSTLRWSEDNYGTLPGEIVCARLLNPDGSVRLIFCGWKLENGIVIEAMSEEAGRSFPRRYDSIHFATPEAAWKREGYGRGELSSIEVEVAVTVASQIFATYHHHAL